MAKEEMCGIYCIENIQNNKKYVGQSIDIYSRWHCHKSELRRNCHCNGKLQNAWNKYGENNFKFYIVEECSFDELDDLERYYIQQFNSYYDGYNLDFGGTNRVRWTQDMRKKLSEHRLNMTEEDRNKCRIAHKNECIPIYQINFDGDIVGFWEYGAREASKKLGICQSCIWNCVNKKKKTYKKYIWIRADEYNKDTFNENDYITHKAKPNAYDEFNLDGDFIKHYKSYKELVDNGLDPSGVLKCAKGNLKSYKGHIFKIA